MPSKYRQSDMSRRKGSVAIWVIAVIVIAAAVVGIYELDKAQNQPINPYPGQSQSPSPSASPSPTSPAAGSPAPSPSRSGAPVAGSDMPYISAISPAVASPGQTVQVTGTDFTKLTRSTGAHGQPSLLIGKVDQQGKYTFVSQVWQGTPISDSQIAFTLPMTVSPGDYVMSLSEPVNGGCTPGSGQVSCGAIAVGVVSNQVSFTVR